MYDANAVTVRCVPTASGPHSVGVLCVDCVRQHQLNSARAARPTVYRPAGQCDPAGHLHHHRADRGGLRSAVGRPTYPGFPGCVEPADVLAAAHFGGSRRIFSSHRPAIIPTLAHADLGPGAFDGLTPLHLLLNMAVLWLTVVKLNNFWVPQNLWPSMCCRLLVGRWPSYSWPNPTRRL